MMSWGRQRFLPTEKKSNVGGIKGMAANATKDFAVDVEDVAGAATVR